jgi:dihydroorotate dehydrogenase
MRRTIISVIPTLQNLIRFLLFRLDPETSHHLVLKILARVSKNRYLLNSLRRSSTASSVSMPVTVMGIEFPNPLGLAAGFDKHATAFPVFAALGFGCIELGTVTPRPQPGNPRPRLFRLTEDKAIINQMGFNSIGLEQFVHNISSTKSEVPLGVNLGKNADTLLQQAGEDYLAGLTSVYTFADYVSINVSSPNTPGLRELQNRWLLDALLRELKRRQSELSDQHDRYVPLALKISPDLNDGELEQITELIMQHHIDAVIATNTTLQRPQSLRSPMATKPGGLSGQPLKSLSTKFVAKLFRHLQGTVPIIGVGGIETADDAWDKLTAGADLLQLYTSIIFQGPSVVGDVLLGLERRLHSMQITDLTEATRQARSSK